MSVLQNRRAVVRAPLIGAVIAYAGPSAPAGWLFCFGQNVSRTTYAALFTVIGTTYGPGDGSTTFGLPDLRGRVPFGKDDMGGSAASRLTGSATGGIAGSGLGNAGGEQAHQIVTAELAAHTHAYTSNTVANTPTTGAAQRMTGAGAGPTASTGSDTPHNTVPPGIVLNYMIFAGA